jgi:hypothetical protein
LLPLLCYPSRTFFNFTLPFLHLSDLFNYSIPFNLLYFLFFFNIFPPFYNSPLRYFLHTWHRNDWNSLRRGVGGGGYFPIFTLGAQFQKLELPFPVTCWFRYKNNSCALEVMVKIANALRKCILALKNVYNFNNVKNYCAKPVCSKSIKLYTDL